MRVALRRLTLPSVLGLILALTGSPVVASGTPTMVFGNSGVGSGCIPGLGCFDDASFQAMDKINPHALSVQVGQEVLFDVAAPQLHQVAIYDAGTIPADIDVNPANFFVDDAGDRIWIDAPGADTTFTFSAPGKYLVICNITPHFEFANMWGWVTVR
jgi:plastocyanin